MTDLTGKSYVTMNEANDFFASSLDNAAWTTATDTVKEAALIESTRVLDLMFAWYGYKTLQTQSLSWPRLNWSSDNNLDVIVDTNGFPRILKDNVCYFANYILKSSGIVTPSQDNVTEMGVGPIKLKLNLDVTSNLIPAYIIKALSRIGDYIGPKTANVAYNIGAIRR